MLSIRRVDPEDVEAMTAYDEINRVSESFEDPYPTPWTLEEQREQLRNTVSTEVAEGYLGYVDDVPVAAGIVEINTVDNKDKVWVFANVLPEHRNRGIGSELLDYCIVRAKDAGGTMAISGTHFPVDADENHHHRRFLTKHGFRFVQAEVHRVLELPADEELHARLETESAAHHTDYTFLEFEGLPPEDIRADYCVLLNQIIVDAPSGDIEYEKGAETPETLVEREASNRAGGRITYVSVALAPDGLAVAHNVLQVPTNDPGKIFNQDTLVLRDHRGHRLGLATKLRNLRQVLARHPDSTVVHTWNAESNGPMIAVNDAMGFRPATYGGEYARDL
jgi:GNAT superfamily N-acetyltransferase